MLLKENVVVGARLYLLHIPCIVAGSYVGAGRGLAAWGVFCAGVLGLTAITTTIFAFLVRPERHDERNAFVLKASMVNGLGVTIALGVEDHQTLMDWASAAAINTF